MIGIEPDIKPFNFDRLLTEYELKMFFLAEEKMKKENDKAKPVNQQTIKWAKKMNEFIEEFKDPILYNVRSCRDPVVIDGILKFKPNFDNLRSSKFKTF